MPLRKKKLILKGISELREHNKLLDEIEEKEKEINRLKEKLCYQDELIDAMNSTEDISDDADIDLESLQLKRYLFVGHTEEDFPELNHILQTFPDSVFLEI